MEPYYLEEKVYTEQDWKLFRSRLPDWQEAFMENLIQEYIHLLSQKEVNPSDRFWALEERIEKDKKYIGVSARMARSRLTYNLNSLMIEGAIGPKDLEGFSDTLKKYVFLCTKEYMSEEQLQQYYSLEDQKGNTPK